MGGADSAPVIESRRSGPYSINASTTLRPETLTTTTTMTEIEADDESAETFTTTTTVSHLDYSFRSVGKTGACTTHFEYRGRLSPEECAAECYNTYGCLRFSA